MSRNIAITFFLLAHYGLMDAHVVEIHLPNAGEDYEIQQGKKELRNQENLETFYDPTSTLEEKQEALTQLIKDEGMS